jgi:hypothetical protein
MVMLHKPPKSSRLRSSTPAAGDGDDTDGSVAVQGAATPAAGGAGCEDVYNESEEDPAYSRAVESSLWEVEALKNHYSPQVGVGIQACIWGGGPNLGKVLQRKGWVRVDMLVGMRTACTRGWLWL